VLLETKAKTRNNRNQTKQDQVDIITKELDSWIIKRSNKLTKKAKQ